MKQVSFKFSACHLYFPIKKLHEDLCRHVMTSDFIPYQGECDSLSDSTVLTVIVGALLVTLITVLKKLFSVTNYNQSERCIRSGQLAI